MCGHVFFSFFNVETIIGEMNSKETHGADIYLPMVNRAGTQCSLSQTTTHATVHLVCVSEVLRISSVPLHRIKKMIWGTYIVPLVTFKADQLRSDRDKPSIGEGKRTDFILSVFCHRFLVAFGVV
jgi:hypothetical protein